MQALVYHEPANLVLEEVPEPHPLQGEVVLRVDAASICGTDLRIAAGAHRAYAGGFGDGRIPGHEIAGTVAEVGKGVAVTEGNRVFVAPNFGCGRCRPCLREMVNLCENPRAIGITDNGAFAEYLLLPAELVTQGNLLPTSVDADPGAIALAEPLACALRGSRACGIRAGDIVLVYGAGPIGLFHVALARLAGAAAVLICDPNTQRRERALAWGATRGYDPSVDDLRSGLKEWDAASGADVVITAASAPGIQQQALELAGPGGRVNFFAGLPRGRSVVELDTNLIHYKELLVTGTTASTNEACRAALDLILAGRIDTGSLIDARLDLASAQDAFELAGSGQVMKVVMQP